MAPSHLHDPSIRRKVKRAPRGHTSLKALGKCKAQEPVESDDDNVPPPRKQSEKDSSARDNNEAHVPTPDESNGVSPSQPHGQSNVEHHGWRCGFDLPVEWRRSAKLLYEVSGSGYSLEEWEEAIQVNDGDRMAAKGWVKAKERETCRKRHRSTRSSRA